MIPIVTLLKVEKERLTPSAINGGTVGSYGFNKISFQFSPEWEGLGKQIVFDIPRSASVSIVITDDGAEYDIPSEVTACSGEVPFSVIGYYEEKALYTVTGVITMIPSSARASRPAKPPTPSEIAQVLTYLAEAKELYKHSFTPKGEYDPHATYKYLDAIMYKGDMYIVKKTVSGIEPADGEYYMLSAKHGESAYEIAVRLGAFEGTEEEWNTALETERAQALESIEAKGAETLATIPEDYTSLNNTVKNITETYAKNDVNAALTYGHFKAIPYSFSFMGNYYQESGGSITVRGKRQSSGIIPAPKNLCLDYGADNESKCFLYFYNKQADGTYTVTFDFFNKTTSNGLKNYVSYSSLESRTIFDIPDDTYLEVVYDSGMVELYGWDGEPFGMDVCATSSIPTTSANTPEGWLNEVGDSGITVPGKAKFIVANGAILRVVHGFKDGKPKQISGPLKQFYKFPEGYDYFRIRIQTKDGYAKTLTGDVRDLLYVVAEESEEKPISNAVKVLDNCAKVCSITWKPKKAIRVNNKTSINFKPDIEYNGLIYGSQWDRAHYIGWHVSPHTFVNAINDEDSIMYNEKDNANNGEGVEAPIYGTVCSAFATMCDGWECPQTNAGFFYDPDIEKYYAHKPQLGQIYTDITSHCVIPSGITQLENDTIVSAYESFRPISAKTTRFMSIAWEDIWQWWNGAAGYDYYNNYGYVVHNPKANPDMSSVPYADFDDVTIINGSARPYKGDKSVSTSAETEVKINIKDSNAKILYLEKENGSVREIPINDTTLNIRAYLVDDGIYYVYTDVDSTKESFEFVNVETEYYSIKNNTLTFDRNDFWYANCVCEGIHYYQNGTELNGDPTYENRNSSVLANSKGDYSKWFRNGNRITKVDALFKKGKYGAYTVPIARK